MASKERAPQDHVWRNGTCYLCGVFIGAESSQEPCRNGDKAAYESPQGIPDARQRAKELLALLRLGSIDITAPNTAVEVLAAMLAEWERETILGLAREMQQAMVAASEEDKPGKLNTREANAEHLCIGHCDGVEAGD